jgi:hypothetical protein
VLRGAARPCRFRQAHGLPDPEQLFGDGVKRFDRHSRTITVEFDGPTGDRWDTIRDLSVYDVRCEGTFTLTFSGSRLRIFGAVLCHDVESDGGYVATSGSAVEGYETARAQVLRIDGGGEPRVLASKTPDRTSKDVAQFSVQRRGAHLTVERNGKQFLEARDDDHTSGYCGLLEDEFLDCLDTGSRDSVSISNSHPSHRHPIP